MARPYARVTGAVLGAMLMVWPALAGCAAAPAGDQKPSTRPAIQPLRVVTPYTVKSLDPIQQGLWAPEWGYGELLMRSTEKGRIEPWVLAGLERTSATAWRLGLRDGVRFHNGKALDADAMGALLRRQLADNVSVKAALPGARVAVAGPTAVTLTTTKPTPNLPSLLADEGLFAVFDAQAASRAGNDPRRLLEAGIYTGPFEVRALGPDAMTLERNPDYWGGKVALPGAEVRFVPEANARVLAVRNGEADLAFYPPTDALRTLSDSSSSPAVRRDSAVATSQLRAFLDVTAAPLDELPVRKALSLGIDYREIAEDVLDGLYSAPRGMYPDAVPYARKNIRTDQAEAKRLLERAGWKRGPDGVRVKAGKRLQLVVLSYSSQPDTKVIATAMQSQLAKVGFAIEVRDVPANYDAMEKPGWHVGLSFDSSLGYTFDPIDPLRTFLHSKGTYNFGQVDDSALDSRIDQLSRSFDEGTRSRLLDEIQRIVLEQQVYALFIAERPARVVAGPAYRGYRPSSVLLHLDKSTAPTG